MKLRLPATLVVATLALSLASPAFAQVITEQAPPKFPDPKKFARGFFASGELGATTYFGRLGKAVDPGFTFGIRTGYDVLRFLAIEARVGGASSTASTPPPVSGQTVQMFFYGGDVRFSLPIRQWSLAAEGGAALAQLSSNVLATVGITKKLSVAAIAGINIDYHTLNRHFSVGVAADYLYLHSFAQAHSLQTTFYMRYTR